MNTNQIILPSIIQLEWLRYKEKGKYFFLALLIFCSYMYFVPQFGKEYYKKYEYLLQTQFKTMYVTVTCSLHTLSALFYFSIFLPVYYFNIKYFDSRKIEKNRKWPWELENWPTVKKTTIKVLLQNHFIILPALLILGVNALGIKLRLDLDSFPTWIESTWQIVVFMILDDFGLFWVHYSFHRFKSIYKFHKVHHEYTSPFAFCGEYAHPLEFIFANTLPSSLGQLLLKEKVHIFTFFMYVVWRIWGAFDVHCGYELPWSPHRILPFSNDPQFHDYHHSKNIGTYGGFFTFWDWVIGSDRDFYKYKLEKLAIKEKEKSQ